jgi:hypothetical protein
MPLNDIKEILGYELIEKEVKAIAVNNPKIKDEVEKWLVDHIGKGHIAGVKRCNLEYVDEDVDVEEMDEFELKEYYSKLKKNFRECPNHKTCPLYMSKSINKGDKCTLELIETQFLVKGLFDELQIEPEDFNDQIIVSQLVGMNILYNRSMAGLAAAPLIEEIKTYSKGGFNIDTKVNEHFTVAKETLNMMEKLRKSLLLNRDDKMKVKQVKKANDELSAKKRVEEKLKNIDDATIIDLDVLKSVMGEDYSPSVEEEIMDI